MQLPRDLSGHYRASKKLNVDLMHNSGARRNDFEVIKSCLTPSQKLVALAVAGIFKFNVLLECVGRAGDVNNHRVIDNHFCRRERVDFLWISTKFSNGLAHCG